MSSVPTNISREKDLPDERYDEKLFKQAYKAGIEAKEIKKKSIRRKKVLESIGIFFLSLTVVSSLCYLIFFREEKPEYIESVGSSNRSFQYVISNEFEVYPDNTDISPSGISAQSALVFNSKTGSILFEKNIDEKRPVASLTKLLSVIVALESFNLEDSIDVSLENIPDNLEWTLNVKQGDRIKIDYILKSMLLSSYNDSAYVLANAYPGGYDAFIQEMNKKAKVLRMDNSSFSNPAGWDSEENYSTARDIGKLVSAVLNYEYILDIAEKGSAKISWNSGSELKNTTVYTTNQLYGSNKYVKGLKTGFTGSAGECFVGYFVYNDREEIITVVLGSENRFGDTQKLELLSRKVLEQ